MKRFKTRVVVKDKRDATTLVFNVEHDAASKKEARKFVRSQYPNTATHRLGRTWDITERAKEVDRG